MASLLGCPLKYRRVTKTLKSTPPILTPKLLLTILLVIKFSRTPRPEKIVSEKRGGGGFNAIWPENRNCNSLGTQAENILRNP